ncbi:hypothetical protein Caci_0101 [Catenulispora acidiphila DSM 44928]|uniref:Myb-like domain-containing protein n=1 Tax=Catenulispora acidiphila (strain DSM 44928 / JCM 14897 / NBRC 102108 / NRRL B-24433 / ID139908) TaxID=479433 RepID=C7QHB7_CATAD|nr:hypothetical protein [Catenulispora acidiphila]ACU69056.1 hypothetical protein Caci_0101 [Catenulispora acidiphila DSM 44928]
MPTQTQPWLRAELIAAPETTPGAQLMIPADGVEFHDDQLVFHHQGDIVYVAAQGQLRSITWFARQPNPETARRKAQWPNHGTRWTDEERADLRRHLSTGHSWKTISHAHGRSRSGCQQEAVKQGWLDPETLQPTPELLLEAAAPIPDTAAAPAAPAAPADHAAPSTNDSHPLSVAASDSTSATASVAASNSVSDSTSGAASDSTPGAESPAIPMHSPAAPHAPTPLIFTGSEAAPTPAHAAATPVSHSAVAQPDRPRIPPRVPRQRTGPTTEPHPGPDPGGTSSQDSDPDTGDSPGATPSPGTRFLSRAQSSLARATLGAYMNPPRGQSDPASSPT